MLCTLKLRVPSGKLVIINNYAAHSGRAYDIRQAHFKQLQDVCASVSSYGLKIVLGDFNARLGLQRPGEESIIGPHGFGNEAKHEVEVPNRDMLLEFCHASSFCVANTYEEVGCDRKVTYMAPSATPMGDITPEKYSLLDLLLCDPINLCRVLCLESHREAALATDHILVTCDLQFETPETKQKDKKITPRPEHF